MKLKYYMRGLGIGIILTTLILSISNPEERLTDAQIKERAQALGMVDKEEASLSEVLENSKTSPMPTLPPTINPEPTVQPEPTEAPTPEPTLTPEPTATPTVTPSNNASSTERDGVNSGELVTFTIESGMSSGKVAAMLVDKGIIKDAEDFNRFIVKEGKASIIRVGTYTLPKEVSYEEIVTKITSR